MSVDGNLQLLAAIERQGTPNLDVCLDGKSFYGRKTFTARAFSLLKNQDVQNIPNLFRLLFRARRCAGLY